LAVKTFTVLNGEGLSRVDFFLTTRGGEEHILVNEI
jgi:D-alanine-D-alanine ligase-like ATP-grasp enzyme